MAYDGFVGTVKWVFTVRDHPVEQNADRPDVHSPVASLTPKQLGREKSQLPLDCSGLSTRKTIAKASDPEVGYFRERVVGQQYVIRREVAVNHGVVPLNAES